MAAVIAGFAGWLQYRGPGSTSDETASTSAVTLAGKASIKSFSIQYPPPEGTEVTPQCITARGTGAVAKGQALVVAVQEENDPRIYFEKNVVWNHERNRWSAELTVGDRRSVDNEFTIFGVVLDRELASYLASTGESDNDTYWSSPEMPPGSYEADQVKVRRGAESCPSH